MKWNVQYVDTEIKAVQSFVFSVGINLKRNQKVDLG